MNLELMEVADLEDAQVDRRTAARRATMETKSDDDLMTLVRAKDRAAMSEIIRRFQPEVLRMCRCYDASAAEDLTRSVFNIVARWPDDYENGRHFLSWLANVTLHFCARHRHAL